MASVPVHTPAERLSEGLSPRQDGCNQMFLVWEASPTSCSFSFRHVPCRLHSSGFLHNARGNDSSTTSVAQEEMHSGLPDVMPVRESGKLACMLMWATGGSLQAIALINRIPAKDQRHFCIHLTSFLVPQETDEGGGPSVSEEEMKRRKNKAVMSWLVSLHTLLMSSTVRPAYTALAGSLIRSRPCYTNIAPYQRIDGVCKCLPLDCSCHLPTCHAPCRMRCCKILVVQLPAPSTRSVQALL